ncbi:MAG: hypothetical protein H8E64_08175 [Candidatus Marinimicrobia bacterium]|nr:hypothetical protein [Candidatus Neomarinimicrobiota bacterium]
MKKDFNEFSVLRITRFVLYTAAGISIYFAGHEIPSSNLRLAAIFLAIAGILGIIRNLMRLKQD